MPARASPKTKKTKLAPGTRRHLAIKNVERLSSYELKWRDRQPLLRARGYQLRPRFRPGWKPSWSKWDWLPPCIKYGLMNPYSREDALPLSFGEVIMDAERAKGELVVMKIIEKSAHPYELDIATFLSELKDLRNHCVPVLDFFDAFDDVGRTIIVMPLLRRFDDPPFETVWEVSECIGQFFEGLKFMHDLNVAHRDCFWPNLMMDASSLYRKPFHPASPQRSKDWSGPAKHISRTEAFVKTGQHVKYYFIDFGISRRYERYDAAHNYPRELPIIPGDKSVPEHQGERYHKPSDPFATDIYLLGNAIRERFLRNDEYSSKLHFLDRLIAQMTHENPEARPRISEVLNDFAGMDKGDLTSRLAPSGNERKAPAKGLKVSTAERKAPANQSVARTSTQPPHALLAGPSTTARQPEKSRICQAQAMCKGRKDRKKDDAAPKDEKSVKAKKRGG
ncbi:hypothetical protein PENSPDRAFT_738046 [Peniophora sp. CONT]|nr:hypothetical protein PENSPDRAFT_738046 [Peniophora sp. CONT]